MKKITLFLAFIGMIILNSCTINDEPVQIQQINNTFVSEVFELRNVSFGFDNTNGFNIYQSLNPRLFPGDVLLIYRMSGTINSNTPIWQQIPRTLFLNEGELDYDFDFSQQDFTIYAGGTYNLALTPSYINNQTFRIVVVPGAFGNRMANPVDYSDYDKTIKSLGYENSVIKKL